ncbi:MAG TPA: IS1595 family transposase [Fimbriimonadaceae bacterium]|jgi:transposase-like protein
MNPEPKTLLEAVNFFSDENNCREYISSRRWPNGVTCPICGSKQVSFLHSVKRYQCSKRHPKRQFTIKTGTIFEDSPLPLQKWLIAMWLLVNCKNGVSSYEIHRDLGVTQKTAWFMLQRIRLAMQDDSIAQFGGHVEVDETYIGAKARNMHKERKPGQRGMVGKQAVMGFLDRSAGEVRTFHIQETGKALMEGMVRANVAAGSYLYSDQHGSYRFLNKWFKHRTVDHAVNM